MSSINKHKEQTRTFQTGCRGNVGKGGEDFAFRGDSRAFLHSLNEEWNSRVYYRVNEGVFPNSNRKTHPTRTMISEHINKCDTKYTSQPNYRLSKFHLTM
ncbi:hypothetical protein GQ457_07G040090 [Hibiscus cannabinus]